MRIPRNVARPFLWLDAVATGGAVRRSVRNYTGFDPEERRDGTLPPGAFPAVLRGLRKEFAIGPESYIHDRGVKRFIGATTGRSGTTWLQNILRQEFTNTHLAIREIGLFDLAQFRGAPYEYFQYANLDVRPVYRRYFRYFILERAYFIRRRIDGTMLGICDLVPRRVVAAALDELEQRLEAARSLESCEHAFGDFYVWLFNAHAALVAPGKEWVSKEPPYGRKADELLRLVPAGKLVVLVRDGRDVAVSMYRARWQRSVTDAMDRWRHFTAMTARALDQCPAERVLVVRYEDLVRDFDTRLPELCNFLELPPPDLDALRRDRRLAPRAETVGGWTKALSAADRDYFAQTCGDQMVRFGLPL